MVYFSDILLILLVLLMIGSVIAWLVLQNIRPNAIVSLTPKKGPVSVPTVIGASHIVRKNFFTSAGSTFTVYIHHEMMDKTQQVGAYIKPVTLFQFGDAVQFQLIPGGKSTPPTTQLVIKTQGYQQKTEIINVKNLPLQKWIYLGIVREGRRFTVYYNGEVITSHRLEYFPITSTTSLKIGDPALRGYYAFPQLVGTPLDTSEMKKYEDLSSDTRHKPYLKDVSWTDMFSSIFKGCPDGLFCFSTSKPPSTNPLKTWNSRYA
jgi:hypothetical protein